MKAIYKKSIAICVIAVGLAGCATMAPEYSRPESSVPVSFNNEKTDSGSVSIQEMGWKDVFIDKKLQSTIELALNNNRDLRTAVLNIEKARATYRIQEADLFPGIDASVSNSAARSLNGSGNSTSVSRSTEASVGFSSWELDLFGKVKSLKNEALESYFATSETQRSTRISLIAEVASDWLSYGAYQQQLNLARKTLESREKTLSLTKAKKAQGLVSSLDLAQIQATVDSARVDVADYSVLLEQSLNALNLVAGASVPKEFLPESVEGSSEVALAAIPADMPSEILLNRPDVLSAEHTLKAANANIGAARAAFFPSISLTASAGIASSSLTDLFSSGSEVWSFAPSVSVPVFNAGSLRASLDISEISKKIEIADYEKTIQTAFSEVADALSFRRHIAEQMDAQKSLVNSYEKSYTLSEARYRNGVDSYLDTLDSQRSLYSAQQTLVTLQLSEKNNRVELFKVLGGDEE
ncbi:efflux transporter outer membrane subunit [Sphaerochaeta sp.]|uniref:efflux transporter outer membrane subunit n=1 Tax=Sphaerochaeta sp. TaxID=1972642 RepID=UPI003D12C6C2